MEAESKPEEIDELDRRILQLKIEREALKKETDAASKERLERLIEELNDLEQQSAELTAQWHAEKDKMASAQKLKEQLDQARIELEQAQRKGDFTRAGELTYAVIPELDRKLKTAEEAESHRMIEEAVTAEHIAGVVSRWTGIPVDKMLEGEREKLLHMEDNVKRRVVGQDEAVVAVANAIRRARAGLARSEPADRLVPVLGADRRRQDRAGAGARRIPLRQRKRDAAHRHVGIYGEAFGRAADRRAAGLCRL